MKVGIQRSTLLCWYLTVLVLLPLILPVLFLLTILFNHINFFVKVWRAWILLRVVSWTRLPFFRIRSPGLISALLRFGPALFHLIFQHQIKVILNLTCYWTVFLSNIQFCIVDSFQGLILFILRCNIVKNEMLRNLRSLRLRFLRLWRGACHADTTFIRRILHIFLCIYPHIVESICTLIALQQRNTSKLIHCFPNRLLALLRS